MCYSLATMTTAKIDFVPRGTVTSPHGFCAGATAAGIKENSRSELDLGIIFSETPCVTAGLFTTSKTRSASLRLCQERVQRGRAAAIVANSGCANAATGEPGIADAAEMTAATAHALGIEPEDVLIASTGVIGTKLPMDKIKDGIRQIALSAAGGHDFARAIMTTDTVPKAAAITVQASQDQFTIGGVAKGSGMIHPDMATMLCFLTTDAAVEPGFLKSALKRAADISLNMVSIDGDTSPSDVVLIMANSQAENELITPDSKLADIFQEALSTICIHLAKAIASDGEGATRLIEVTVNGAASTADARLAARTVVSSPLVKTAVHGSDPNWGRITAALGRCGVEVVETKIDIAIGSTILVEKGLPVPFSEEVVVHRLNQREVPIRINLNLGIASATAWGCDLSQEYVTINSQYTT